MKRILIASAVALAAGGQALAADLPPPWRRRRARRRLTCRWSSALQLDRLLYRRQSRRRFKRRQRSRTRLASTFTTIGHHLVSRRRPGRRQLRVLGRRRDRRGSHVRLASQYQQTPCTATKALGGRCLIPRSATINNRWLTTATGKLGYAWDRVLLYGKGGGAWVGANNSGAHVRWRPVQRSASIRTQQQFWLDRRCRRRMGVLGQLVGARRVRLYRAATTKPIRYAVPGGFSGDTINSTSRNISCHRRPELQVRRLVVSA